MARMTGGKALVDSLMAHGVDTAFGIISIHALHIYDALYHAQGTVRFIGARHEHAAGHMADGYARVTGRPGVFLTSTGPGAALSVGAMGEAYHASVPLLQVTTNIERGLIGQRRGVLHEPKDQLRMFQSVAEWTEAVDSPEAIPDRVYEAFRRFRTHHPRPAVLEVPVDVQSQEAEVEVGAPDEEPPPAAQPALVDRAVETLLKAKRPFIYAGQGVLLAGATRELTRLAEALDCPVALGASARGALPPDHPLCLGSALVGRVWKENPLREWMSACDAAVVVGSSLPHRTTTSVGLPLPRQLVHVDIDPTMFGRNYPVAFGLAGSLKAVLAQMLGALGDRRVQRGAAFKGELEELKGRVHEGLERQFPNELRLSRGMGEVLARDAIVVCDTTVPWFALERCLQGSAPERFFGPHGWVGIGYGFPAAIGAQVGQPGRQVVCVTGDGGFQCNVQEMATCVQYGVALVVIILNDNAWGTLKAQQQGQFGGRVFATELTNPDFVRLADAYGIQGVRVTSQAQLVKELGRALHSGKPEIIEAAVPSGFANFT